LKAKLILLPEASVRAHDLMQAMEIYQKHPAELIQAKPNDDILRKNGQMMPIFR